MCNMFRIISLAAVVTQLAAYSAAAANYVLDNNGVSTALNASDGAEARDNWFANKFTVQAGANWITEVDFGVFTTTLGSVAEVALYRVTGPGGNPALGATRVYTQAFTPLTGDGTSQVIQSIPLWSPVEFSVGDQMLVSVFIPNVIANPPNDVYPYLLDTSASGAGSYWGRSNPNLFNLDDLSGVVPIDQNVPGGTWSPGANHLVIRAVGMPVPEPSTFAFGALALLGLGLVRRWKR